MPRCFFVGLLDRPIRVEAGGVVRFLAARIHAWAVGRLRSGGSAAPQGGWTDAVHVFGPRLDLLTGMIAGRQWDRACEVYDQSLLGEIGRWRLGEADRAVAEPFLAAGSCPTAAVADDQCVTPRQVERRVRALTGTSPKQLAGLARFHRARDAIWADPSVPLARLAIDAGYADQPHLTREFRRYSGQTPARFARESAARKRWLAAEDVAFVQERAAGRG